MKVQYERQAQLWAKAGQTLMQLVECASSAKSRNAMRQAASHAFNRATYWQRKAQACTNYQFPQSQEANNPRSKI